MIEVTSLIPNPKNVYMWGAAAVTVTTGENQTFTGKCNADLYFHVILPESFTTSSLAGLFKLPDDTPDKQRPISSVAFKEIDGKKILVIPVVQIASVTFE